MRYVIRNGHVIDPSQKIDGVSDILVSAGRIEKIGPSLGAKADGAIDAKGMIVAPGLVDMHAHLREPGREDKETVKTGTAAAVAGGFTTIACMPNTDPAIDSVETVKRLKAVIAKDALCSVRIIGAITAGRNGKKLVPLAAMKKEGIVAVSDDGSSVADARLMLEALKACKKEPLALIEHCEDTSLSAGGVMNRSFISTKMGLRGIPAEAEYACVQRDIDLARKASCPIHIAHVSCKGSVDIIRKAKKAGIPVTAETAPHYLALTDECCATYDTNMKMNPPLRSRQDVDAVKKGLADGTIDAIATDHAPHTDAEKDVEFDYAPFGVIGLETALSIAVMELIDTKTLSWSALIAKLSHNPAKILGLPAGTLKKGAAADIVIIDPERSYTYLKSSIVSKSKNSPFIGWQLKGKAVHVFIGGKQVVNNGEVVG